MLLIATLIISLFSEEKVLVSKAGDQSRVAVAITPSGNIVAVAEDTNCSKPEKHICLFYNGEELADDSFVSSAFPSVAVDSNGNIYVVWADASQIDPNSRTRTWDIYLRKKIGNSWQNSERINGKTTSDQCGIQGDQIKPDIYISGSEIHIVWQSIESNGRSFICYVKSPDLGASWTTNKKLFEGYSPSVAVKGNKVFIAFSDINGNIRFASSQDGGNTFSLRTQNVSNASQRIPDLSSPDITISPSGNLLLVWQDKPTSKSDIDIFFSVSKDDGTSWGTPQQLDLPGDQTNPSVVFFGGPKIFFSEKKSETLGLDIYYVEQEGNLSVARGEFSPSSSINTVSGVTQVVIFQMKVTASDDLSEAEVKSITVKAFGSMDESNHISNIYAWWDKDGNGVISSPDILLSKSKFSADNGTTTLGVNIPVVTPNPEYIIFSVDLAKPIPRGRDFRIEISPSDVLAVLPGTSKGVRVIGPTLSSVSVSVSNNIPAASVSASPSSVLEGSGVTVILNASSSYDPDGDPITFSWRQVRGITVSLSSSGPTASFSAPSSVTKNEILTFEVTVADSFGGRSTAEVSVTVVDSINEPPVAIARVNISGNLFDEPIDVNEGDIVVLDGSLSYDPNGDNLVFFWSQVGGPKVEIFNPSGITAYFVAPDVVGLARETVIINLSVRDSKGAVSSDEIKINVKNTKNDPPRSSFDYNPKKGLAPLDVEFDASSSFDPDGSIISYRWNFGDGTEISTTNTRITHRFETPGEYIVTLTVYDNGGDSDNFSATVTALSSEPELFLYTISITQNIPFGTRKDIGIIRVSNVSGESIMLRSLKMRLSGIPDASVDFFIDYNNDRIGDVKIFSYSLKSTSDAFFVPLDTIIPGGESINIILSATAYPFSIPADYTLYFESVDARSSVMSVEPKISGISLPQSFRFGVKRPAILFSASQVSYTAFQGKVEIPISIRANGANFTLNSIYIEYNPVIFESIQIFSDSNGNGKYDSGDELLAKLESGNLSANLSLSLSNRDEKKILIVGYLAPATAVVAPKFSAPGNTHLSLLFYLWFSVPVIFGLIFTKVKRQICVFALATLIFALNITCANKAGKGIVQTKPEQKQSTEVSSQEHGQIPGKTTSIKIKSVGVSSSAPEFDIIGIPLEIKITIP
jgi:PKD repeat protein